MHPETTVRFLNSAKETMGMGVYREVSHSGNRTRQTPPITVYPYQHPAQAAGKKLTEARDKPRTPPSTRHMIPQR